MESKRLPAQFGLTAKQAFLPVLCVCWGFTDTHAYACVCLHLPVGVCLFVFLYKRENTIKGIHAPVLCVYVCVWLHVRHIGCVAMFMLLAFLIPECFSLPEVRPWAAYILMSLLLKNSCSPDTLLHREWLHIDLKVAGLNREVVVQNLLSLPAGCQPAFMTKPGLCHGW